MFRPRNNRRTPCSDLPAGAGAVRLHREPYYLIGFREWAYRRRAVAALGLRRGDTVVEIGCGTGLNLPLLREAVGPEGKVVGVNLTDAMLDKARRKAVERGWSNVTLVRQDALAFEFPEHVDGILSTFAISLIPECGQVVLNGSKALAPGGRWVVLDLKLPAFWPERLLPLLLPLVRPFAVTEEVVARRPWDAVWEAMRQSLVETSSTDLYPRVSSSREPAG